MAATLEATAAAILRGETYLGIELGSTRIKAILIDGAHRPIASGSHGWENRLEHGIWTYSLEDIWSGVQASYAQLAQSVRETYGCELTTLGAMGVSAMMHGYMAFDARGELLAPFRTWRNTITGEAAQKLTQAFNFNIPQRWSIAHLYQAILNGEAHVADIHYLTTLAGYIHWRLTGEKLVGVGEASGMFPIDCETMDYDAAMLESFTGLAVQAGYGWKPLDILPGVRLAGEPGGRLTEAGALLLDPTGALRAGIPLCPPEGDAGTGMTATNSVMPRTCNVSAGTSVFAMSVLEKPLSRVYPALDIVTTPAGDPVAMVHCNNCSGDLDAWVGVFCEALHAFGLRLEPDELYGTLYAKALSGDPDCGGLLAYNYISGEHITEFTEGRPLFVRGPQSTFDLANFMRVHLYTALGALKIGMDILFGEENVRLDAISGHGGLFKAAGAAQRLLAAALNTPVTVMKTAGEGGPWGMAILAAYMSRRGEGESLAQYLNNRVFAEAEIDTKQPDPTEAAGFSQFMERYVRGLAIERAAVEAL